MRRLSLFFLFFYINSAIAQEVLVPLRVGNLFGLSDLQGNLKVKPAFDYIEPIGYGYYKYSNYTKVPDTIHWANGRVEIREKINMVTGVLFGRNVIIKNSNHRHFTVVKNKILIGSEESYISKNSNFYNIKGKKLLSENVEKFKFLANDRWSLENTPVIAIFAEHFDKSFSILLYDVKKQNFSKPLISHGKNVKIDRNQNLRDNIVLSYNDDEYNSYKVSIYFDDNKQTFVKEPFINKRDHEGIGEGMKDYNDVVVESDIGVPGEMAGSPEPPRASTGSGNSNLQNNPTKIIPKKVYPFLRLNDSLISYNQTQIKASNGKRFLFPDRYSKSQKEPVIFSEGKKYGLIFSDSSQTTLLYDTLRYIKNQYSIFSAGYNYIYLAGKINDKNKKMIYGIIDVKGNEIIPIMYESLSPNLSEIYLNDDDKTKKSFAFRQPYNYSNDKNALLSLNSDAVFTVSNNGKFGLVNMSNEILLPIEYDNIWKNGFSFLKTFKVNEDFCVYRKGDLYGVFNFSSKVITNNSGLIFPKIPVYVYRNYMDIKNLNIYNLATANDLFFCLASDDGTIYYREN